MDSQLAAPNGYSSNIFDFGHGHVAIKTIYNFDYGI